MLIPGSVACFAQESKEKQVADDELKTIRILRSQRKFDEVEKRIDEIQGDLTSRQFDKKVLLEIERIQSNTARSFENAPATRIQSLQEILAEIDGFIRGNAENPNIALIEAQKGFTTLNFGELLRMEIEAGVLRESSTKVAFQILRSADRVLEEVDKKLAEQIPDQPKKPKDPTLSQRQLISLQNQVRYQRIKSKINRGLLYGQSDPDNRVAVLSTCKAELRKLLPLIDNVDDAWWSARLDYLMCYRITSDFRNAYILFGSFPVKEAPPEIRLAFKAEMVRLALDSNQMKKAEDLIATGRVIEGKQLADFDFAILEFFLKKKELANDQEKREVQETLVKIVKAIERRHGTYWGRRANMALLSSAKMFGASGSTTRIRLAQDHYRKKEYALSIAEFEKAAAAARQELNRRLELELRFQAVTIHKSLKQYAEVVRKSRTIASEFKDTNRAAVVHLVGIVSAAEWIRTSQESDRANLMEQYLSMLDYHMDQWPDHVSIGKVGNFRGEYRMAQSEFVNAALDLQKSVLAIIHDQGALDLDAFEKSAGLLGKVFGEIRRSSTDSRQIREFVNEFQGTDFFEKVEEKTSSLESTLNCWARYALDIESASQEKIFARLVKETEPVGDTLSNLLRLGIATSKVDSIPEWQQKIQKVSAQQLVVLLSGLERDWNRGRSPQQKSIARIVGQLPLTAEAKKTHWKLLANCFVLLNQRDEALSILNAANSRQPQLLEPRLMQARTLSQADNKDWVEQGLTAWRDVLNGIKPKSNEWFEAKYEIARSHQKLGAPEKALKMLQLTKAIPPGWSESTKARELDALFKELSR